MPTKIYTIYAVKLGESVKKSFEGTSATYRAKDSKLWLIAWDGDIFAPENAVQMFTRATKHLKEEIELNPDIERIEVRYHYNNSSGDSAKIPTTYPIRKLPYVPSATRDMPFKIHPVRR